MFAVDIHKPVAVIHTYEYIQIIPDDRTSESMRFAWSIVSAVKHLFCQVDVTVIRFARDLAPVDLLTVKPECTFTAFFKVYLTVLEKRLNIKINVICFVVTQIHKLYIFSISCAVLHILYMEEVFTCVGTHDITIGVHCSQPLRKSLYRTVGQSNLRKSCHTDSIKEKEAAYHSSK
ncbi:MAG: hypothetical protein BWZ04_02173 [Firmicutes bacterium ADurb.BinA205]|nr:MAG: hypothetical protein BWZ04_02173 [Firmicutes bacterium ADurb.BinA205]